MAAEFFFYDTFDGSAGNNTGRVSDGLTWTYNGGTTPTIDGLGNLVLNSTTAGIVIPFARMAAVGVYSLSMNLGMTAGSGLRVVLGTTSPPTYPDPGAQPDPLFGFDFRWDVPGQASVIAGSTETPFTESLVPDTSFSLEVVANVGSGTVTLSIDGTPVGTATYDGGKVAAVPTQDCFLLLTGAGDETLISSLFLIKDGTPPTPGTTTFWTEFVDSHEIP